jgi:hypothetical protein
MAPDLMPLFTSGHAFGHRFEQWAVDPEEIESLCDSRLRSAIWRTMFWRTMLGWHLGRSCTSRFCLGSSLALVERRGLEAGAASEAS